MGSINPRYNGAIHSKEEYIIFVDSEDIVLKNGIIKVYNYIKNNNLDIVEFHSVFINIKHKVNSLFPKNIY